ncbi:transposase, partial [Sinorhizobium meliloti]
MSGCFQSPDRDFDDAAHVQCRSAGQDCQAEISSDELAGIYNESLRQRGDLTIWVKDEALSLWTARRRTSRGGQPKYSDLAITLCLTLRVVY